MRDCGRTAVAILGLGVVLAGLLVGAALADRATTPTVTIDTATFSGKWREGWFRRGTLRVAGTISDAAQLEVTLRTSAGEVTSTSTFSTSAAGTYRRTLKLPARPLPGKYPLTVSVVNGGVVSAKAARVLNLPSPPEGVIGKAIISARPNGAAAVVVHSLHQAYARFHFLTLPPHSRIVTIQWRTPNYQLICQTSKGPLKGCKLPIRIPADGWIRTYLRSFGTPLAKGNWECRLSVGSVIAKRAFVRLR